MSEHPEAKYLRDLADRFESPQDSNALSTCASKFELLVRSLDEAHRALSDVTNERDAARAALEEINMMACYASEEDTDSREAMLLRIGVAAREAITPSKQEAPK